MIRKGFHVHEHRMFLLIFSCAAALTGACGKGETDCIANVMTVCEEGAMYWVDSCGNRLNKVNDCACGCNADSSGCLAPCSCTPACTGRCGGPDGCEGECPDTCTRGTCQAPAYTTCSSCAPDCSGRECGMDPVCGTLSCGTCSDPTPYCTDLGQCVSHCTPSTEVCDGVDNDCDGTVDEEFGQLGQGCTEGTGQCARSGVYVCSDDRTAVVCNASPAPPSEEVCDGLDNDCDGAADEELSPPDICLAQGVCAGTVAGCDGGEGWVCHYPSSYESSESLCDELDNDCDGEVDDDGPMIFPGHLIFHEFDVFNQYNPDGTLVETAATQETLRWIKKLRCRGVDASIRVQLEVNRGAAFDIISNEIWGQINAGTSRKIPYWFSAISSDYNYEWGGIPGRDCSFYEGDTINFCLTQPLCYGLFYHEMGICWYCNDYCDWTCGSGYELWTESILYNTMYAHDYGKSVIWSDAWCAWRGFDADTRPEAMRNILYDYSDVIIPMWANNDTSPSNPDDPWMEAQQYVHTLSASCCDNRTGASIQGWYWWCIGMGDCNAMPVEQWTGFSDISYNAGERWILYECGWNTPIGRTGILNFLSGHGVDVSGLYP